MKRFGIAIFLIAFITGLLIYFFNYAYTGSETENNNTENVSETTTEVLPEINVDKSTVSYNKWLHTDGSELKNEENEIVQLRGLSSHGIEWFYDILTKENISVLKNEWNTNVFRIAMYTDSNGTGYIFNKEANFKKVCNLIDIAIDLDMYVIVDWHILDDNSPQKYKEDAKIFFDTISKKYANVPNIIYEICNEPNGGNITWMGDVKPYAEEVIPIIRNNSSKALIIVGTPDWCKDLKSAADSPLNFNNIVYSCHFYAGTHNTELRNKIDYCLEKGIPIFVSECGATTADGNGQIYKDNFSKWIEYLDAKNISWIYWSFCNKDEGSAVLVPEYTVRNNENVAYPSNNNSGEISNTNNIDLNNNTTIENNDVEISNDNESDTKSVLNINDYLSESGKFIKDIFLKY